MSTSISNLKCPKEFDFANLNKFPSRLSKNNLTIEVNNLEDEEFKNIIEAIINEENIVNKINIINIC